MNIRVMFTKVYFKCPRCKKIKPGTHFGLRTTRNMNGAIEVRNQSHCKDCRGLKAPQ